MNIWGIDLGGTKIECAVMNRTNPETNIIIRKRIPTEAFRGYEHILNQIKKLIDQVSEEIAEKPVRIGFGTPGVLDPGCETMKNCNTTCLNGKALHTDLENLLKLPVKLANDANCFALAETISGVGKDYPDAEVAFGVIMGTGVGGGLVVHKKIITGHHGIAGEWGHNILEADGERCYCGQHGCVETVISGPALERKYTDLTGETLKLNEIYHRHLSGIDQNATLVIERLLENFGKAIATLANIVDPDLIIIGGGVGNIDLLYSEGYDRIKKYIFNSGKFTTPVCKPRLGDSAGVLGAALLWA